MTALLSLAGTFWSDIVSDPSVKHLLAARSLLEEQTELDRQTLISSMSRITTPIFHDMLIEPLLLQSKARTSLTWVLPANLVHVYAISDSITTPKRIMIDKMDYVIEEGKITFFIDPFTDSFPKQFIYDKEGNVVDEAIQFWLVHCQYDEHYLQDLWGAQLNLLADSSEEYKELLNIVYEVMIKETSKWHIDAILALFHDAPITKEDEVVEVIGEDNKGVFVATDKRIYRTSSGKPIVTVGAQLPPHSRLFDVVSEDPLTSLTIPKRLLNVDSDLTFENKSVPLRVADGNMEFDIVGDKKAVKQFFEEFNVRRTHHLRDEPYLYYKMINPYEFIRKNVLKYNSLIYKLTNKCTQPLNRIDRDHVLRMLIPPHATLLLVELDATELGTNGA